MDLTFYNKYSQIIEEDQGEDNQQHLQNHQQRFTQYKGLTLKQYFNLSNKGKSLQIYKRIEGQPSTHQYKIKCKNMKLHHQDSRMHRNKTEYTPTQIENYQSNNPISKNEFKDRVQPYNLDKKTLHPHMLSLQNPTSPYIVKNSVNLYSKLNSLCKKTFNHFQQNILKRKEPIFQSHQQTKIDLSPKVSHIKQKKLRMKRLSSDQYHNFHLKQKDGKEDRLQQIIKKISCYEIKKNITKCLKILPHK